VPVPGVDQKALTDLFATNDFLQLLNIFSGGGLSSFSIVALGVNPYINASIIMQLMTYVVPRLQQLSREGEYGRNQINKYTRWLAVPMGIIQAYGYLALLSSRQLTGGNPVISNFDFASLETWTQIVTLTAGTIRPCAG
jgi:preprotein translocase subunit SecY